MMPYRVWTCRWCGDGIPEYCLYVGKRRKEYCSFRCVQDMKNFRERMFGDKKIKTISKNPLLQDWLEIVPYLMIERKPMKQIAIHLNSLMRVSCAEPIIRIDEKENVARIVTVMENQPFQFPHLVNKI